MSKIKLTGRTAIGSLSKLPIPVAIGTECEGFLKRLTLDEFFEIQNKMMSVEEKSKSLETETDKKDADKTREIAEYSKKIIVDIMIEIMRTEAGEPAFTEEDRSELETIVNPRFTNDFIMAFMSSQGVSDKKEVASAEAEFPTKPRTAPTV